MGHLIHPASNLAAVEAGEQLTLARGEGIYVYDDDGKQYLEGMAGLWCAGLGYGNTEVAETIKHQTETLCFGHMFSGRSHEPGQRLAEKLAALVPIKNARISFGSSGSDANDSQIKFFRYVNTARGKPEKVKIIARENGYHGVTLAASALTGLPIFHKGYSLPLNELGIVRVSAPYYYRNGQEGETEAQFTNRLIKELETTIAQEGADTIAAMICEPIQGAGGVIVPPDDYLKRVKAVLDANDIALIADEVITGFGRTGDVFGMQSYDTTPTTISMAKQLTAAFIPLSAVAIPEDMYQSMVEFSGANGSNGHGYTYSGHPVATATGNKVLEIYERDGVYGNAKARGETMQEKLSELAQHPAVGNVRGKGLIGALEFVADKASKRLFKDNSVALKLAANAQAEGLIVRPLGNNTIGLCPPMVITDEELDELFSRLQSAISQTEGFIEQQRQLS